MIINGCFAYVQCETNYFHFLLKIVSVVSVVVISLCRSHLSYHDSMVVVCMVCSMWLGCLAVCLNWCGFTQLTPDIRVVQNSLGRSPVSLG